MIRRMVWAIPLLLLTSAAEGRKPRVDKRLAALERQLPAKQGRLAPGGATAFGADAHEEFVAVGSLPDGTVVAVGNTWGPTFPTKPEPTVLGSGKKYDVPEYVGGSEFDYRGNPNPLARDFPNLSGFVVHFAPDLTAVRKIVKFDWYVATIDHAKVLPDGAMILTGRCSEHFRPLAGRAPESHVVAKPPDDRKTYGHRYYEGLTLSGDVYVGKLSSDASRFEWVWIFEGHRETSDLYMDGDGGVYTDIRGWRKFAADGSGMQTVPLQRQYRGWMRTLDISPVHGGALFGGSVIRDGWHKPRLVGYDPRGRLEWELWPWGGSLAGHPDFGIAARAAVTAGRYDADGKLLVAGRADAAPSAFDRNPVDIDRPVGKTGLGLTAEADEKGPFAYLMRMDPETLSVEDWTLWRCFGAPRRRRGPQGAAIGSLRPLPDGSVAVLGRAGAQLVQTPESFIPPKRRHEVDGQYAAVMGPDLTTLRFSSYVPGCRLRSIGAAPQGVLYVGTIAGDKAPIARNAYQKTFGGGRSDGFLLLLRHADAEVRQ